MRLAHICAANDIGSGDPASPRGAVPVMVTIAAVSATNATDAIASHAMSAGVPLDSVLSNA